MQFVPIDNMSNEVYAEVLRRYPTCSGCGRPASIVIRAGERETVATDPDADELLPMCGPCAIRWAKQDIARRKSN